MRKWLLGFLFTFTCAGAWANPYLNLQNWHHNPFQKKPLLDTLGHHAKRADVFYIHPTIRDYGHGTNSPRFHPAQDDRVQQAIWNQTYPFVNECRIFAPAYRHAFLSTLMKKDTVAKKKALDTAYSDIQRAFETYLSNWNSNRPIIIASHSQGSYLALRLIEDYLDHENAPKLVAAYILGYTVPEDLFHRVYQNVTYCMDSTQTNCLVSWRTFGKHGNESPLDTRMYMNRYPEGHELAKNKTILCTNPLNWTENPSRDTIRSTLVYPAPQVKIKQQSHVVKTQVLDGKLFITFDQINAFNGPGHDLHVYDYTIFSDLIRRNVTCRINAYFAQSTRKE